MVTLDEAGARASYRVRTDDRAEKCPRVGFQHSQVSQNDRKVILVVDDDPAILQVRKLVFEVLGYRVLIAYSGEEALEHMQQHRVDLIVLDYTLPEMNGEQTARLIRSLHGNVPIVLSSSCCSVPDSVLEVVDASVDKVRLQALTVVVKRLVQTARDASPTES
jgi:CheY-like chemotaxis protein